MGKKIHQRSMKAQEEFAKSLITLANTIHGAIFTGILVLPLTVSISSFITKGTPPFQSLSDLEKFLDWVQAPLIIFVCLSIFIGIYFKGKALDILDRISSTNT